MNFKCIVISKLEILISRDISKKNFKFDEQKKPKKGSKINNKNYRSHNLP